LWREVLSFRTNTALKTLYMTFWTGCDGSVCRYSYGSSGHFARMSRSRPFHYEQEFSGSRTIS
jgi:hypothetical protein